MCGFVYSMLQHIESCVKKERLILYVAAMVDSTPTKEKQMDQYGQRGERCRLISLISELIQVTTA